MQTFKNFLDKQPTKRRKTLHGLKKPVKIKIMRKFKKSNSFSSIS